jgi:hypothetical protein
MKMTRAISNSPASLPRPLKEACRMYMRSEARGLATDTEDTCECYNSQCHESETHIHFKTWIRIQGTLFFALYGTVLP